MQNKRNRNRDSFDDEPANIPKLKEISRSGNNGLLVSGGSSGCYVEEMDFSGGYGDRMDCSGLIEENRSAVSGNTEVIGGPPSVIEVGSILKNPLLDLKLQPLTFNTDDISDSELEEYLEHITELSEEQPLLDNTKSPEEGSSSISQPCSADDNTSHLNQITTESTDVDTVDTTTIGSTDSSIDENIPTEDSGVVVEEPKPLNEVPVANEAIPPESISIAEEPPEETATPAEPEEQVAEPQVSFNDTESSIPRESPISPESTESLPVDLELAEDDAALTIAENEVNENIENVEKSASSTTDVHVIAAKEVSPICYV